MATPTVHRLAVGGSSGLDDHGRLRHGGRRYGNGRCSDYAANSGHRDASHSPRERPSKTVTRSGHRRPVLDEVRTRPTLVDLSNPDQCDDRRCPGRTARSPTTIRCPVLSIDDVTVTEGRRRYDQCAVHGHALGRAKRQAMTVDFSHGRRHGHGRCGLHGRLPGTPMAHFAAGRDVEDPHASKSSAI